MRETFYFDFKFFMTNFAIKMKGMAYKHISQKSRSIKMNERMQNGLTVREALIFPKK